jgi:hypothetical protein
MYTGETGHIWDDSGTWNLTTTDIAVASTTTALATNNLASCETPNGTTAPCVVEFVPSGSFPGGSWQSYGGDIGAEQVVFDGVTNRVFLLDNASGTTGKVSAWVEFLGRYSWSPLTMTKCVGGGAISFAQIAAKNNVVYGLDEYGTVFFYPYGGANCWTQVGGLKDFAVSIATDNGWTTGVWATDAGGFIWSAE